MSHQGIRKAHIYAFGGFGKPHFDLHFSLDTEGILTFTYEGTLESSDDMVTWSSVETISTGTYQTNAYTGGTRYFRAVK